MLTVLNLADFPCDLLDDLMPPLLCLLQTVAFCSKIGPPVLEIIKGLAGERFVISDLFLNSKG